MLNSKFDMKDIGLEDVYYTKYPVILEDYCDANWILDLKESKSMSGYVFMLSGVAMY